MLRNWFVRFWIDGIRCAQFRRMTSPFLLALNGKYGNLSLGSIGTAYLNYGSISNSEHKKGISNSKNKKQMKFNRTSTRISHPIKIKTETKWNYISCADSQYRKRSPDPPLHITRAHILLFSGFHFHFEPTSIDTQPNTMNAIYFSLLNSVPRVHRSHCCGVARVLVFDEI